MYRIKLLQAPILSSLRSLKNPRVSVAAPSARLGGGQLARIVLPYRSFSTNESPKTEATKNNEEPVKEGTRNEIRKVDFDEYDDYEPQTPKEKVSYYFKLSLLLGGMAAGAYCIYILGKELFPGRLSPNSLFSEAFEYLRYNNEIQEIVGGDMKAFGQDRNRNVEGRRNHVESYRYKADDGSERQRVRFHIKGSKGHVLVWAEVSDNMPSNEYVYVIVQNLRNGQILTFIDNRDQLEAGLVSGADDGFLSSLKSIFKTDKN